MLHFLIWVALSLGDLTQECERAGLHWANPALTRAFKTRSIRTAFENAVAEAKLDNFHFHDLRHHFASWFVMRGGSLQALKEILGHADLKMTLRYAHLAPDHLRNEIEKTDGPPQITEGITHDITHEPATREALSRKYLVPKRGLEPRHPCGH